MEKNVKAELLVVDDHSLILEGICKIVNKMPEVTVADAVASGKQAIKLIEERDYDVYIPVSYTHLTLPTTSRV
mgnify:CR=1 FL=1